MAKKKKERKTTRRKTSRKTTLKPADIEKFKKMLLEKRVEILGNVSSMTEETLKRERSDLSNVPFHMADAGSDNFELENTLGLMDEEVRLLGEIDAALERIENGTYGICEGSGKPIPKARLEAIPWTRYCREYAEMIEKGLVSPRSSSDESDEEREDQEIDEEQYEQEEEEYEMAEQGLLADEDEEEQEEEQEEEEEEFDDLEEALSLFEEDEEEEEEDELEDRLD